MYTILQGHLVIIKSCPYWIYFSRKMLRVRVFGVYICSVCENASAPSKDRPVFIATKRAFMV